MVSFVGPRRFSNFSLATVPLALARSFLLLGRAKMGVQTVWTATSPVPQWPHSRDVSQITEAHEAPLLRIIIIILVLPLQTFAQLTEREEEASSANDD